MTVNFAVAGAVLEPSCVDCIGRVRARVEQLRSTQFAARTDADRRRANDRMVYALMSLYEVDPNAFSLSAGSLTVLQASMMRLGMLDLETQPGRPPLPKDFGLTVAGIAAYAESGDEPLELARFNAARDAFLDRQADNPTGIPAYKITTPQGWLITPDEITAALGAYRTSIGDGAEPPRLFWWPYWIEFLECAGKYLGARVG